MISRILAHYRLKKARARYEAARQAYRDATDRQDTRAMHEAALALRKANHERIKALVQTGQGAMA